MRKLSQLEETALKLASGLLQKAFGLMAQGESFVEAATFTFRAIESVLCAGGFDGSRVLDCAVQNDARTVKELQDCVVQVEGE